MFIAGASNLWMVSFADQFGEGYVAILVLGAENLDAENLRKLRGISLNGVL
jgi:hypothetical protein